MKARSSPPSTQARRCPHRARWYSGQPDKSMQPHLTATTRAHHSGGRAWTEQAQAGSKAAHRSRAEENNAPSCWLAAGARKRACDKGLYQRGVGNESVRERDNSLRQNSSVTWHAIHIYSILGCLQEALPKRAWAGGDPRPLARHGRGCLSGS